jgi:hypothetical protein
MENQRLIQSSLLVLALALSGCGSPAPSIPVGPSPIPPQAVAPPPVSPIPSWPPGTLTAASLSGVIYESTPTGHVPIPGAVVYCELCGEITHTWAIADANGFYLFPGEIAKGGGVWLAPGQPTPILVRGVRFEEQIFVGRSLSVLIAGDTRLDVELVRR